MNKSIELNWIAWHHFCVKCKCYYIWRQSDANALRLAEIFSSHHFTMVWCLKCSLVCVCYGHVALSSTELSVRGPFHTGDRLCGSTVCDWACKVYLVIQKQHPFMFNDQICRPLLIHYNYLLSFKQGSTTINHGVQNMDRSSRTLLHHQNYTTSHA